MPHSPHHVSMRRLTRALRYVSQATWRCSPGTAQRRRKIAGWCRCCRYTVYNTAGRIASLRSSLQSAPTALTLACTALLYPMPSHLTIRNLTLFPLPPFYSPSILLNSIQLYFIPFYSVQLSSITFSTTLSGRHTQLLRHDRARCGFIGCHQHGEHGGSRRTGSGALGQQVVDLRGNGSEMQGKVQWDWDATCDKMWYDTMWHHIISYERTYHEDVIRLD